MTLLRQGGYTCGMLTARSKFHLLENQWCATMLPGLAVRGWRDRVCVCTGTKKYKQQCTEEKLWAVDLMGSNRRNQDVWESE